MFRQAARTLLSMVLTLWAIATGTFFLMERAPGGPASGERRLDPLVEAGNLANLGLADLVRAPCDGVVETVAGVGARLSSGGEATRIRGPAACPAEAPRGGEVSLVLVRPGEEVRAGEVLLVVRPSLWVRYGRAMASVATLELGVTYGSRGERTVRETLARSLPVSATLGLLALLVAGVLGIPAGLFAAAREGTWADRLLTAVSTAQVSVPAIVLGPFLLYLFAVRVPVFAPGGLERPSDLVLPAATLGLIVAGVMQRMTRAGAAGFLHGATALHLHARGLSPWRLAGVHALRHAAIPMLGYLPPVVAGLLSGSLVVERVFNLPGVSRHLIGAALNRDYPLVMGVVLLYSALLVALTSLAALLHPVLDPRLRAGRFGEGVRPPEARPGAWWP